MSEHPRIVWRKEQTDKLLEMKLAKIPTSKIASYFGISISAVANRYARITRPEMRLKEYAGKSKFSPAKPVIVTLAWQRNGEAWSEEETAKLLALIAAGKSFPAASVELQRTTWACKNQFYLLRRGTDKPVSTKRTSRQIADIAAAEARASLAIERCPIAEMLGEPPPGRSALDRIRAGIVEPPVYMDGRTLRYAPKITLPTKPFRCSP